MNVLSTLSTTEAIARLRADERITDADGLSSATILHLDKLMRDGKLERRVGTIGDRRVLVWRRAPGAVL